MRTNLKSSLRLVSHSFGGALCVGAVMLIASGAQAQNLFVANDNANGTIYAITPSGAKSTFASGLNIPAALAVNGAGDLFVATAGDGNIYEYTPGGVQSIFASGLYAPYGMTFNSAGDLFVAAEGSGNIYEYSPGGVQSIFASGMIGCFSLAFNSVGDLFVGNLDTDTITEISPNGQNSTYASVLHGPYGLAVNSAGDLFAAVGNSIIEITTGGTQSTFASGLSPWGLAFDGTGNLFEADYGSGNVYEFTSTGAKSTFASGLSGIYGPDGLAFQPVPEPSAWGLLAVGVPLLLPRRRHRNLAM